MWRSASLALVLAASACGSSGAPTGAGTTAGADTLVEPAPSEPPDAVTIDGVSGELILTRQRDLIDRGLINVRFHNDGDVEITMTERRLVARHFRTEPAPERVSRVPDGRPVNLQVPFGTVDDCTSTAPVTAELLYRFHDASGLETTAVVSLTGTELLDDIRRRECGQHAFDESVSTRLTDAVVDGEQLTATLVVTPRDDAPAIEIGSAAGTILVGARLAGEPVTVAGTAVGIDLVFEVNRCDPHAMAEVTKRYGLDLTVRLDDADPVTVDVALDDLTARLDTIVGNCRNAG